MKTPCKNEAYLVIIDIPQELMFPGTLSTGYDLGYTYGNAPGKHFQLSRVTENYYRKEGGEAAGDSISNTRSFYYDPNGNLKSEFVARNRLGNNTTNNISRRKLLWDGLNRLRGISEDGYVSLYWYDADGNRTVKEHLGGEAVWVNGTKAGVKTDSMEYSIYPSPYLSITGNRWTKHYYIGSERIASRTGTLGDFAALHTPDNQSAGNGQVAYVNYAAIRQAEEDSIASYYAQLGVPYQVQRNTRGSGVHLYLPTSLPDDNRSTSTASEYASSERDRDSLRNTPATLDGGQVYYYHRDPLGSTLSVSDSVGTLVQQVEYTPWGEVFVELRGDSTFTTPYLFNGKELDEETGLYYYGARYYDPKMSVWYSVDPISNYNPLSDENHLDGEHNGGVFNPSNLNPYIYCYHNPIKYLDPNGEQVVAVHGTWSNNKTWKDRNGISRYASRRFGNNHFYFDFRWSGGNFTSYRHEAADKLIEEIRILRHKIDNQSEPITLVGHSHGGNVCIEAMNKMLNMKEFDNIKLNLLTINTPVRPDYQLNDAAVGRVVHINVFDPNDPIQAFGGNLFTIYDSPLLFVPSPKKPYGEYGPAGRQFKNAHNIEVNNPQGLFGDFHNSHNRVNEWSNK